MTSRTIAAVAGDTAELQAEVSSSEQDGEGSVPSVASRRTGRRAVIAAALGALATLAVVAAVGHTTLHGGQSRLGRATREIVGLQENEEADAVATAQQVQELKSNVTTLQNTLNTVMQKLPPTYGTSPMLMPAPTPPPPELKDMYLPPLGPKQKYCGALIVPETGVCCNGIVGAEYSFCCAGAILCNMGDTCCGSICCGASAVCCNGICGAPNAQCTGKIVLAPKISTTQNPREVNETV